MLRRLETFFQGEKKIFGILKKFSQFDGENQSGAAPGGFYSLWNRWVKKRLKTIRAKILEQSETYEYKTVATR